MKKSVDDLSRYLELLLPERAPWHEQFVAQPFWKSSYPNEPPGGRLAWPPESFAARANLESYLRRYGGRLNLGVAPCSFRLRSGTVRRRLEDWGHGFALAADLDVGPGKPFGDVDGAAAALEAASLPIGLATSTGTGLQAYVVLDEPTSDLGAYSRALGALVSLLGGDRGARAATAVFRPPGSLNFKYQPPRRVELLWASGYTLRLEQVLALEPHGSPAKEVPPDRARGEGGTAGRTAHTDLAARLDGAVPARFRGDKSARDFSVACELAEQGLEFEEALHVLERSTLGKQAYARKHAPADYLERTVRKAFVTVYGEQRHGGDAPR